MSSLRSPAMAPKYTPLSALVVLSRRVRFSLTLWPWSLSDKEIAIPTILSSTAKVFRKGVKGVWCEFALLTHVQLTTSGLDNRPCDAARGPSRSERASQSTICCLSPPRLRGHHLRRLGPWAARFAPPKRLFLQVSGRPAEVPCLISGDNFEQYRHYRTRRFGGSPHDAWHTATAVRAEHRQFWE